MLGLAVFVVIVVIGGAVLSRVVIWGFGHSWLQQWRVARWISSPSVQVDAFDDNAMNQKIGAAVASLARARVGGGRETGEHLYLVTGEKPVGNAIASLSEITQTKPIAALLKLLEPLIGRKRLRITGALLPVGDDGTAALSLSLQALLAEAAV